MSVKQTEGKITALYERLSREEIKRQEAAKKRERECTCENCGTVFITNRKNVKYCCESCMKEANRKRQQELRAANKNKEKTA